MKKLTPRTISNPRVHCFFSSNVAHFLCSSRKINIIKQGNVPPHHVHHHRPRPSSISASLPQDRDERPRPGLFPAGKRQTRVDIPALFITLSADNVTATTLDGLSSAIVGGATAVVLRESPPPSGGGAAQLYSAAVAVKEILRDRAMLLIADRTDIADAIGAQGVMLSPAGLPTVVAKDMLQDSLSLVGRLVEGGGDGVAAAAAAEDGANFIVLHGNGGPTSMPTAMDLLVARQRQRSGQSVPLLARICRDITSSIFDELMSIGMDGVLVELDEVSPAAAAASLKAHGSEEEAAAELLALLSSSSRAKGRDYDDGPSRDVDSFPLRSKVQSNADGKPVVAQLSQVLNAQREELVAAEKQVLSRLLDFLKTSCPSLDEIILLDDAVAQLDELFLLVVVGEFNSGKSAVINALLGRRVLAEGILPTTNEISVLKWDEVQRDEQNADGLFVRYIPADLLKEINVVDTPGTNVILDRQQRLTEEFVPRADLVLFVLSADRPFTDSEVKFLRYIREWGKKVVFVVNKVDLLAGEDEIREVSEFVKRNARQLLGVDNANVVPVSARRASEAKLSCRAAAWDGGTDSLTLDEQNRLASDPGWITSRFEQLEFFIKDFLLGGEEESQERSGRSESVRLKLRTPLFVAEALIAAARTQLLAEAEVARADAASVSLVRHQLESFDRDMAKEEKIQQDEVRKQVMNMNKAASDVVDVTLQLSNWEMLSSYVLGPGARGGQLPVARKFQETVPKETSGKIQGLVKEHSIWVQSNCLRQTENYRAFAEVRAAALGSSLDMLSNKNNNKNGNDGRSGENSDFITNDQGEDARRRWRESRSIRELDAMPTMEPVTASGQQTTPSAMMSDDTIGNPTLMVANIDLKSTEVMLEEEVRDAVMTTTSTTAGAGAVGLLLTSILPSTTEDLLALGLGAAVSYASLLNFPLRRAEAKKKIEARSSVFMEDICRGMTRELQQGLTRTKQEVMSMIEPLEVLTAQEVERADAAVIMLESLADEVAMLQKRAAGVE